MTILMNDICIKIINEMWIYQELGIILLDLRKELISNEDFKITKKQLINCLDFLLKYKIIIKNDDVYYPNKKSKIYQFHSDLIMKNIGDKE